MTIRRYVHRDGFSRPSIKYIEVAGDTVTIVKHDGTRELCPWVQAADARSFVELGWWVECGENATLPGPDYRR